MDHSFLLETLFIWHPGQSLFFLSCLLIPPLPLYHFTSECRKAPSMDFLLFISTLSSWVILSLSFKYHIQAEQLVLYFLAQISPFTFGVLHLNPYSTTPLVYLMDNSYLTFPIPKHTTDHSDTYFMSNLLQRIEWLHSICFQILKAKHMFHPWHLSFLRPHSHIKVLFNTDFRACQNPFSSHHRHYLL